MFTSLILQFIIGLFSHINVNPKIAFASAVTVCCTSSAKSQGISGFTSNAKANIEFRQNTNLRILGLIDTGTYMIGTNIFRLDSLGNKRNDAALSPDSSGMLWTTPQGAVKRTRMSTLFTNPYMATLGVMSVQTATDSIASLRAWINGKLDTAAAKLLYQPLGSYATTSQLALKTNISDTANMLSTYLRSNIAAATYQPTGSYATTTQLGLKVNISDTAGMLTPYLRKIDTASLSTRINTKGIGTMTSLGLTSSDITVGGSSPVTSSGTYTLTLPIVNSNVGTFNNITVNAKGLATAASNVSYLTGNQTVTLSGDVTGSGTTAITTTLASVGTAGTYERVTTDANGRVTAGFNISVPVNITSGSKSFNTAYQVSATNACLLSVSPNIACTLSLATGQEGSATLQISPNGTTGWISIGTCYGSNTGSLSIGLNTVQKTGSSISTYLPLGYYWQLLTTNVTSTPTYTFLGGSYTIY